MLKSITKWSKSVQGDVKDIARLLYEIKSAIEQENRNLAMMSSDIIALKDQKRPLAASPPPAPPQPIPQVEFSCLPDNSMHCPICERGKIRWVSAYPSNEPRFRMATILFCDRCGSGNVPDADALIENYYAHEYASSNRKDRNIDPAVYFNDAGNPKTKHYFFRSSSQLVALRELGAQFENVLDYGSGPGYFLYKSEAKHPYAVELDGESDKYLQYIGATKIEPGELPDGFFDIIVASHVVEHFTASNLRKTLSQMIGALKPGGFLLVEVPHGGHSYITHGFREDPHTLFFTPQGIKEAIENAGGKPVKCVSNGGAFLSERSKPIYTPPQDDFLASRLVRLTVIATK